MEEVVVWIAVLIFLLVINGKYINQAKDSCDYNYRYEKARGIFVFYLIAVMLRLSSVIFMLMKG